jgi:hypothetical protein
MGTDYDLVEKDDEVEEQEGDSQVRFKEYALRSMKEKEHKYSLFLKKKSLIFIQPAYRCSKLCQSSYIAWLVIITKYKSNLEFEFYKTHSELFTFFTTIFAVDAAIGNLLLDRLISTTWLEGFGCGEYEKLPADYVMFLLI